MKLNFSIYDVKYFFKKNQKIYLWFLVFFLLGIIAGIFIAVSTDSYLSLLSSSDKIYFDFVNGTIDYSEQVASLIIKNVIFELLVFALCLNFYSGLVSYLLVSYQSTIMFLSITAILTEFGFSGVIIVLFLQLPVNLIMFANNIIFSGVCFSRSLKSKRTKLFSDGFESKEFWLGILVSVLFTIVFSCLIILLFVLVLRSRIFILF